MPTHLFTSSQGYSSSKNGFQNSNSTTEWNADYDGNKAHIDMKWNNNGKRKHVNIELSRDELKELMNVPSVQKPLHLRLMEDFSLSKRKTRRLVGTGRGKGKGKGNNKRGQTRKR
jgi:hypothetical protein